MESSASGWQTFRFVEDARWDVELYFCLIKTVKLGEIKNLCREKLNYFQLTIIKHESLSKSCAFLEKNV